MGLIFVTFGYSYSYLLLSIYGGPVLTDGSGGLLFTFACLLQFITLLLLMMAEGHLGPDLQIILWQT